MKKVVAWLGVIVLLLAITFVGDEFVDQRKLKEDYYEVIVTVGELFKDHTLRNSYYYNSGFHKEEAVAQLLGSKVTTSGFEIVVNSLFDELDNYYVYKPKYQEYIVGTRDFSNKQKETTYYSTVRNSILNPALKLIPFEKLKVSKEQNRIKLEANQVQVQFYDEKEHLVEHHPYARFGFPPKDYINFSIFFVYKNGEYLLDEFNMAVSEM